MVQLLSQVVYETNADVTASYEAMAKNPLVVVADQTDKGLLWFKFKDNQTVFLLSPQGKLQVKWNDVSEKRTLFKLVRNLLVSKSNEKLAITPVKQQTWINYPVPESFRLYWCDKTSEYILKTSLETGAMTNSAGKRSSSECGVKFQTAVKPASIGFDDVKVTLEDLRRELVFREPTLKEAAVEIDLSPAVLELFLKKAGWEPRSEREAISRAETAINLAGWIHLRQERRSEPELVALALRVVATASLDDIARAKAIIRDYPHLVPRATRKAIMWTEEAAAKWRQVFGKEPTCTGEVFDEKGYC